MDKNNSKKPVYFSKRAIGIIGLGDKIKARFDEIKKDPSLLGKNVRETLLSEEI